MRRIALIRNSYSYDVGGAEVFPINLAKILVPLGYEPVLLSANKRTLDIAKEAGVQTAHSPWWSFQNFSGFGLLLLPVYLFWMLAVTGWYCLFILRHRIDIVHPQSRDDFIAATFAARLLGKKVVWTDHADLKYVYANHLKWYKNPVGKLVYLAARLANHVHLISVSEKRLVEASLGKALPAKYSVVYPGVVDNHKSNKLKHKNLVFVATSRLVRAKGVGELIDAFKLIDHEDSVLRLYGDGPDASAFKAQAGGAKNIEFMGHANNIVDILQDADIFVHPSYHEGLGLSLVEAEMSGLPIIACNVGAVPEVVKDGVSGMLVPPMNTKELAEAMDRLAKNPELRASMGKAGRQIYLDSFQFDKIVKDQLLPLYEK